MSIRYNQPCANWSQWTLLDTSGCWKLSDIRYVSFLPVAWLLFGVSQKCSCPRRNADLGGCKHRYWDKMMIIDIFLSNTCEKERGLNPTSIGIKDTVDFLCTFFYMKQRSKAFELHKDLNFLHSFTIQSFIYFFTCHDLGGHCLFLQFSPFPIHL